MMGGDFTPWTEFCWGGTDGGGLSPGGGGFFGQGSGTRGSPPSTGNPVTNVFSNSFRSDVISTPEEHFLRWRKENHGASLCSCLGKPSSSAVHPTNGTNGPSIADDIDDDKDIVFIVENPTDMKQERAL